MSVSGPCLWLPSPAAPVSASHYSAISSHHPSAAWGHSHNNHHHHSQDQNPSRLSTEATAIPAVSSISRISESEPISYSGHELMPPKQQPDDRTVEPNAAAAPPLPRPRLEKLNCNEPLLSASRKDARSASLLPRKPSPDEKRKLPDEEACQHEREPTEGAMASSDDGAGSSAGGEHQYTSSETKIEKKKMKRFRLTHNQTRYLMSEFTRQAHPDAAHRERLSKEIPGLTPRQVQVWFQNRRAKLKRLTSNDRERMLKSRALPDDFDTTQVLRTPFEHKSTAETPMLLTGGLQRSEDEYAMSPLSAPSAGGSYFSSTPGAERPPDAYAAGLANRAAVPTPGRGPYPFPRSSSFSDAYPGIPHLSSRYSSPSTESLGHAGMPYARRPVDYGIARAPSAMVQGYDPSRTVDGSVSPSDQQESIPYGIDNQGPQVHSYHSSLSMPPPKPFGGLDMNSPMQPSPRQIPAVHSIPVSDSSDYRPYSYESPPYSINSNVPYTQASASSMSLPATFPPETGHMPPSTTDGRMNPSQMLDPVRAKFGGQSFDYASYI